MKMTMHELKKKLRGIIPVQYCPYTKGGELDVEGLKRNTQFLVDFAKSGNKDVPLHLRNPVTPLMKDSGYGEGYKYAHEYPGHFVEQQNLPDSLQGNNFYNPSDQGYEKQVLARLKGWRQGEKA